MEKRVIQRFDYNNQFLFKIALNIREKVFVEEQGVDRSLEIEGDEEAIHYLLWEELKAIATARWRLTEQGIKLERFAILPEFRNKKIGSNFLERIIKDITYKKKEIYLNSQEEAVNFYKRNGFDIVGDAFIEADIKHYKMILNQT